MNIVELLSNLITKKYYENKEVITNKVNFFFALNQIAERDYEKLMLLTEETYIEVKVEENTNVEEV